MKFKDLGSVLALPPGARVTTGELSDLSRTRFSHLQSGKSGAAQRGWWARPPPHLHPVFLCRVSDVPLAVQDGRGRHRLLGSR